MKTIIFLLLNLLPIAVVAETSLHQSIDSAVNAEMEKQEIVGAAIGIVHQDQIFYTNSYGYADFDSKLPMTDKTIFKLGSNSKPIIAMAAMQLAENGKLNLDEPIETYLPNTPSHLKHISTRQLLSHQSGIPHYEKGKAIPAPQATLSVNELNPAHSLYRFIDSPLIFDPGTKIGYSSYAYILLTAIVQAAGKEGIAQQLNSRIERPIGLESLQLDIPFKNQKNLAKGYVIKDGQPTQTIDTPHFWKHGAGGYNSNIKDLTRFALALMNKELIGEETSTKMWTRQKTNNGRLSTFGLGVIVSGNGKSLKISHRGSQDGIHSRIVLFPNQKHGVVVMCNTEDCKPGKISAAIYSQLKWLEKPVRGRLARRHR